MKNTVQYVNRTFAVSKARRMLPQNDRRGRGIAGGGVEVDGFLLDVVEPPDRQAGRALFLTRNAVWECTRDGKGTPVVIVEQGDPLPLFVNVTT